MKTVDARGLSCPEPVIRTKNALASGEKAYTVMVDNVTARENVSRFAMHQGYQVSWKEDGEDFILTLEYNWKTLLPHFFPISERWQLRKSVTKKATRL